MRLLLGGIAAALALAVVPSAASANHDIDCTPEVAVVCVVVGLTCHRHYHPCS